MTTRRKCSWCGRRRAESKYTMNPLPNTRPADLREACDECKQEWARNHNLKNRYGITAADYQEMFDAQGGECASCKLPAADVATAMSAHLHVDHNHETGEVRGLLCDGCNRALGFLREDAYRAWLLIHYMAKTG